MSETYEDPITPNDLSQDVNSTDDEVDAQESLFYEQLQLYYANNSDFAMLSFGDHFSLLISKDVVGKCKVMAQNEICRNRTGERATSFALPSFWLYKPLPEHVVPIALHTAYTICQAYICVLATGLSSLYYPVRPIRRRPMLRMTSH